MKIGTWYFVFHKPTLHPWFGVMGHVEAIGVTRDDTWFFFNPARTGTQVWITYKHDDVTERLAQAFDRGLVLRMETSLNTVVQIAPLQTCASVCAQFVGMRAYTPWGFRRKLLKNNAEEIYDGRSTRIESIETSTVTIQKPSQS